jgi:hypothetical protein
MSSISSARAPTSARPRFAMSSRIRSRSVSPASAREISTVALMASIVCSSSSRRSRSSAKRRALTIAIAAHSASIVTASSSAAVNSPSALSVK